MRGRGGRYHSKLTYNNNNNNSNSARVKLGKLYKQRRNTKEITGDINVLARRRLPVTGRGESVASALVSVLAAGLWLFNTDATCEQCLFLKHNCAAKVCEQTWSSAPDAWSSVVAVVEVFSLSAATHNFLQRAQKKKKMENTTHIDRNWQSQRAVLIWKGPKKTTWGAPV